MKKMKKKADKHMKELKKLHAHHKAKVKDIKDIKAAVSELYRSHAKLGFKIGNGALVHKHFNWDDFSQQIVGALIVSMPFVASEEVWNLARSLNSFQVCFLLIMILVFDVIISKYTKFQKVKSQTFLGVPYRIISLLCVSFGINVLFMSLIGVIGPEGISDPIWAAKLVLLLGFFSSIGAGAADVVK